MDTNFDAIIEKLKEIHNAYPEMRFGQVVQLALDTGIMQHNVNLNDRSSKEILTHLTTLEGKIVKIKIKEKEKADRISKDKKLKEDKKNGR